MPSATSTPGSVLDEIMGERASACSPLAQCSPAPQQPVRHCFARMAWDIAFLFHPSSDPASHARLPCVAVYSNSTDALYLVQGFTDNEVICLLRAALLKRFFVPRSTPLQNPFLCCAVGDADLEVLSGSEPMGLVG